MLRVAKNNNLTRPADIEITPEADLTAQPEAKLALESLFKQNPNALFFDDKDVLTDESKTYAVPTPDPKQPDKSVEKSAHLSLPIVRYPRKPRGENKGKPVEYRYAVCKYLAVGYEGVTYKSDATLKFVTTANGSVEMVCKKKVDSKKVRIVKQFLKHRTLDGNVADDDRIEGNKALREWSFMDSVGMPGLKTPIIRDDSNRAALIMHCIEGKELFEHLETDEHPATPFTVDQLLDLTILIGNAIQKVHDAGIIHRDLKPENILIDVDPDNNAILAVVIDFGLAKWKIEAWINESVGSERYASPEAYENSTQDERSDAYSFTRILIFLWQMFGTPRRHIELSAAHANEFYDILARASRRDQKSRASLVDMMDVFNKIKAERTADKVKAAESASTQNPDHQDADGRNKPTRCARAFG